VRQAKTIVLAVALLAYPAAGREQSLAEARDVMRDFAACAVKKAPDRAAAVVLDDLDNRTILSRHGRLVDGNCLKGNSELRMPGDYLRFAIAEALIAAQLPAVPLNDLSKVAPLTHREHDATEFAPKPGKKYKEKELAELEEGRLKDLGEVIISKYGECVVRVDPANSRLMLAAAPSSKEEETVFATLVPALSDCLAAGQQLKMQKAMVRGTIAVNYYRLAKAPRLSSTAEVR